MSLLSFVQNSHESKNELQSKVYSLGIPKGSKLVKCDVIEKDSSSAYNLDEFKTLFEFSEKVTQESHAPDAKKLKIEGSSVNVNDIFVRSALERSSKDETFWSAEGCADLLSENMLPPSSFDLLFNCILKYGSFKVLWALASKDKVVEDVYIVKTIKKIIQSIDAEEIKNFSSKLSAEEPPLNDAISQNLCFLTAIPFNEITMKDSFKLLTSTEALVFLQFLYHMLHVVSPALSGSSKLHIPPQLNDKMVFKWLDCLLLAHLTTFTTSPQLQGLIVQLNATTSKLKRFYREISTLAPYLEQFNKKIKLSRRVIKPYKLETITL